LTKIWKDCALVATALLRALGGGDVKQFEGRSGVEVQARKGCLVVQ
jgi:hypothetical protein